MDAIAEASTSGNASKYIDDVLREIDQYGTPPTSQPPSPTFTPHRSCSTNSSRSSYVDSVDINPLKRGLYENSTSFDARWAGQENILCLDGGGIRGYSALLILYQLMMEVEKIEKSHPQPAHSSYHPQHPRFSDAVLNGEPAKTDTRRRTLRYEVEKSSPLASPKSRESFYPW